jgi:hypothetical protein
VQCTTDKHSNERTDTYIMAHGNMHLRSVLLIGTAEERLTPKPESCSHTDLKNEPKLIILGIKLVSIFYLNVLSSIPLIGPWFSNSDVLVECKVF